MTAKDELEGQQSCRRGRVAAMAGKTGATQLTPLVFPGF
jgi:hypothetical protein